MNKLNTYERTILLRLLQTCHDPNSFDKVEVSFSDLIGNLMSRKSYVKYCDKLEKYGYITVYRYGYCPNGFRLHLSRIVEDITPLSEVRQ